MSLAVEENLDTSVLDESFENQEDECFPERIDPVEEICFFFSDHGFNVDDTIFTENDQFLDMFFALSGYNRFSKEFETSKIALRQIALHNI
jgi:hypothetical protein